MALSSVARQKMQVALANADAALELADAVDAATVGIESLADVSYNAIEATVTLTNAVKTDLATQIPAGAKVTSVHVNLDTLVVGDASGDNLLATVGLGIVGTVGKYGATAALTKNSKITKIPSPAVLAAAETVSLYAIKADGTTAATEKFVAGSTVSVKICYELPIALPDAA